jgi:hypothetical protein
MSGLPWIRFDTSLPDNPKILLLCSVKDGHRAAFVYCCSLAYAGKHGTDGFIPREALTRINGRTADADRLVDVDLWKPHPGGWDINGWSDKQESTDETKARSERAKAAAAKRWSQEKAAEGGPQMRLA